ncbi:MULTISPECIES: alpha/beta fold hydrolase [unclassified Rhizobium]|uniref:alpha/beta fold hydrolase n=1 Tax=unclassified Rhizobium TaxID=2613769 RepID=UPI001ADD263F|nr:MULTISPECIES: alpha/beta hydrolase [unclassified Rhizobium]MBO9123295.1 alpha/beta hydrolase [Rhizobium sp. 16-488-2b]MBO9173827.1 alpha/beta hydrolase [Rhizobium sp. 16-488-2a]
MHDCNSQAFQDRTYISSDGLTLHLRDYDPGCEATDGRLPVVCLPGLTRNSRDFHQLALILSQDPVTPRRVIALDYRGRGLSDWDDNKANYNLAVEARDVIEACAYMNIDRAAFIGTSRGGLILHLLAGMKSDLVAAAVLNDIGPIIEAAGLMKIRDDLNTARLPRDMKEAAALLKQRQGADFPALSDDDWAELAMAIYRDVDGQVVPDVDPAIARELVSIDFTKLVPNLWAQYENFAALPLMVIRGENSALLTDNTLEAMAQQHPDLKILRVPDQGHPPLMHQQTALQNIQVFLAAI